MPNALDDFLALEKEGKSEKEIIAELKEKDFSEQDINDAINQSKIKKEVTSKSEMQPSIMQQQVEEEVPVPIAKKTKAKKEESEQQVFTPHVTEDYPYPQYPQQEQQPQQQMYDYSQQTPQYNYGTYQQYPTPTSSSSGSDIEAIEEIAEEIVNEKMSEMRGKIEGISEFKQAVDARMRDIDERVKRIEINIDRLQAALIGKVQEYSRSIKDLGTEMRAVEGAFSNILNPLVDNIKELNAITEKMKTKETKEKAKK